MNTKIDICNMAITIVGGKRISSFEDGSDEAGYCGHLYNDVYENALQSGFWRFSYVLSPPLSKLANTPEMQMYDNRYRNAFQLPSDFLRLISIEGGNGQPYDIFGTNILSNNDTIQVIYQSRTHINAMPAYFRLYLVYSLAEVLCHIIGNEEKLPQMTSLKEKQAQQARAIDATQQGAAKVRRQNYTVIGKRV